MAESIKKLSPLQIVAREMSEHSSLSKEEIEKSLTGVVGHLNIRASRSIEDDVNSDRAVEHAQQYQAISELILFFGSQLIAFEDIDADTVSEFPN